MTEFSADTESTSPALAERLDSLAGWLTLSVVLVILAATLFPFHFSPGANATRRVGLFLFWFTPVQKGWAGWLLNIALFLPFGFGFAWWARVRGWQWLSRPIAVGAAGFFFSYAVEFLQLFVVRRSSSWDDVVMNTAGSLLGGLLCERWGAWLLRSAEAAFADLVAILER